MFKIEHNRDWLKNDSENMNFEWVPFTRITHQLLVCWSWKFYRFKNNIPSSYINVSSYVTRFHPHDLSIYARNATHATRGKTRADTRDAAFFPNGGVGGFEGRGSRSGFPGMEITKFHRAAKIRAQRGPPYSQKQVCRGNKTGINLHGRVGNNGRETGVHRRERKLCARAAT